MLAALPDHFAKRALLIVAFIVCSSFLFFSDVVRRRRAGQDWNEALAQGSKLLTGNVWLDGALFVVVLAALFALVIFAILHTW
jgi:hypothetical protein